MKIVATILTVLFQIGAAAVGLLILLLVLNGYSEQDTTPGLLVYLILNLGTALGFGIVTGFAINRLRRKTSLGSFAASTLVTISLCLVGTVIVVALFAVSILLAELRRTA